jgi:hypothetical protein
MIKGVFARTKVGCYGVAAIERRIARAGATCLGRRDAAQTTLRRQRAMKQLLTFVEIIPPLVAGGSLRLIAGLWR